MKKVGSDLPAQAWFKSVLPVPRPLWGRRLAGRVKDPPYSIPLGNVTLEA